MEYTAPVRDRATRSQSAARPSLLASLIIIQYVSASHGSSTVSCMVTIPSSQVKGSMEKTAAKTTASSFFSRYSRYARKNSQVLSADSKTAARRTEKVVARSQGRLNALPTQATMPGWS